MQRKLFRFSQRRFCSLTTEAQHKKCVELLRNLVAIEQKDLEQAASELRKEYSKWCSWMGMIPLDFSNFEALENRFSWHARFLPQQLPEHSLLFESSQHDGTKEPAEWLSVTTYLDGLRSCHNVGSILRTVEAFRLGPVLLSHDMASPTHPQILATSMGASEFVTVSSSDEVALPRPWIAVETVPSAMSYSKYNGYTTPMTLIFGNEARGIRFSLLQQCDMVIQIPLCGFKNSLNVANCHAILASWVHAKLREGV